MELFVKAPTRIDLAGGTIDIWPLYCFFENSKTINIAINGYVEIICKIIKDKFLIKEKDNFFEFNKLEEIKDTGYSIFYHVFSYFDLKGFKVEILNMPPKMSGLGGSSSLLVCLLKGISFLLNKKIKNELLIKIGRDLEAKNMGYPTGTQDFYPPIYGGGICIKYEIGKEMWEKIKGLYGIKKNFLIYNTKVPHHSGKQNFDVLKKAILNKKGKTFKNLKEISRIANEVYFNLKKKNFKTVGKLIAEEWDLRKELSPEFNHPEIEKAIEISKKSGAWGWKPCGAAGGGSIVFLVPEEKKDDLIEKLKLLKGEVLPYNIVFKGIEFKYVAGQR